MALRPGVFALVGVAAFGVGACSQPEYTVDDAQAELADAGLSPDAARCVTAGLEAYFTEEFLALQESEGLEAVSQRQVDNYVRNRLAGVDAIDPAAQAETDRLVAECAD